MKIINLTPHVINVVHTHGQPALAITPDGSVSRVATSSQQVGVATVGGTDTEPGVSIPIFRVRRGAVVGLPSPVPGVLWLTSALVREAVPNREDVVSPGELVRDDKGQPVGCLGLTQNGEVAP